MTVTAMPKNDEQSAQEETKGGKKKKLVLIVLVLLVVAGAAWFFVLRPKGEPAAPEPGEVAALEPIQVNLAAGHYLRLGLALQLTAAAHEADGSKALDTAITTFSGLTVEQVNDPKHREELRVHLVEELEHRYHGDVMDVYFTEFVTQ